jgi:hypothetical protein
MGVLLGQLTWPWSVSYVLLRQAYMIYGISEYDAACSEDNDDVRDPGSQFESVNHWLL